MKHGIWTTILGLMLMVAFLATGCDESTGTTQDTEMAEQCLSTGERLYAETALVAAEALGEQWTEVDRGIAAYTRYRKMDARVGEGNAVPGFREQADKLVGRHGPCRIVAGIAYSADDMKGPEVSVLYFYHLYRALPLTEDDPLPDDEGRIWRQGEDGLALGIPEQQSQVLGGLTQSRAESIDPEDALNEDEHEELKADSETPEPQPEDEVSDTSADSEEEVAGEDGQADDKDAVAEESEADDVLVDESDAAGEDKVVEDADDAFRRIYLAANGLMVEIRAKKSLPVDELDSVIASIRSRLGEVLESERQFREEVAARRRKTSDPVVLEKKANPAVKIYWGLLEKAAGKMYETKY